VVNPVGKEEITEEVLNTLVVEDALAEDFCQLSLNALSSADNDNSIKLRTLVKNKVMLLLLDSGSSHSFISSSFVAMANLPTIPVTTTTVKLANGQQLNAQAKVLNLQWYIQGHTLHSDMLVIDMGPYDAILGFDWLKLHSPMPPCSVIGATKPSPLHMQTIQSPSKAYKPQLYKPHPFPLPNCIRLPKAMTLGPLSCLSKPLNLTMNLPVLNLPTLTYKPS